MTSVPLLLVLILALSLPAFGAYISNIGVNRGSLNLALDASDYEDGHTGLFDFDFIVIGAGASGSVVATRLANETSKKVLLLEGGARGSGQRDIGGTDYVQSYFKTDPVTGQQSLDVPLTRYDVPTAADSIRMAPNVLNNMWPINNNGPLFSQAKVVGGNQATNGMAWLVPQKHDFDAWGIPGWNSTDMWPYIRKIEDATATGYGNSPDRGNSGPIHIQFATFVQQEQYRFLNACVKAGYPAGGDMNTGNIAKAAYLCQSNIKNGIRQSTSIAYLARVLGKSNLEFRRSATVTRILFNAFKRAIGVEYVNRNGHYRYAFFSKEVIVAAGDLQTAKLLMNSGIGPASTLNAFGIPSVYVNNIIGQKIRNHQRATLTYSDPSILNANFYSYPAASIQYASQGTGIYEGRGLFFLIFNSSDSNSARLPYPDVQATPAAIAGATPSDVYSTGFAVTVLLSRNIYANATLNLTSADPLAPSLFTANLFVVQDDAERVARGMIEMRRVMKTYWNGNATELVPGPSYDTVPKLVAWMRTYGTTACHYHGSAPMGLDTTSGTDQRLNLRGVNRVRIVGPAAIPGPVFPGMQLLATVIGEKATDIIKQDYSL